MSDPLPQSLIDRVLSDHVDPPPSLDPSSMRSYASQKLLQLTPTALDALSTAMSSGAIKERIVAAQEVLRRSPATRDESLTLTQQLPPAFAALFVESLKSLASYLPVQSDTPPPISLPQNEVEVCIEP